MRESKKAVAMWHMAQVVLLNLMFWPLAMLVTGVFTIVGGICITAYALVTRNHRNVMWLLRRTISHYGEVILKCGWPLAKVEYQDMSPDDQPPFVVVCNHRSSSDGFMLAVLPVEGIQVVNIWPFKIPLLGAVAKLAGYLSVREMPIEDFVARGKKLLDQGVSVAAFPEGTRSGTRIMGQFHSSAFKLACEAGVKIVPLAIAGNERMPPRGSILLHPGRIKIHKLPAVDPMTFAKVAGHVGSGTFALKTKVRQQLQDHLNKLEAGLT